MYKVIVSLIIIFLYCCIAGAYAQEQDIAESFGLYSKGIDYYHKGKLYEAQETLEQAVMLDPRNDEAQGYLDLVNAEIRMREKGRLDFYQDTSEFQRESGGGFKSYAEVRDQLDQYENEPGPDLGPPGDGYDSPEEYTEEYMAPEGDPAKDNTPKIRGEYKMAIGVTGDDFIWKQANGDYNERNFRMIDHDFPKTNTYDTRVYDRLKVVFDTNPKDSGLNFHSDITVDPWSFTGKTKKFTVTSDDTLDRVELELKYWSGTRSTINEKYYSLDYGRLVNAGEYKVRDDKIPAFSLWSEAYSTDFSKFSIPEQEIDYTFQPVRELWFDVKGDSHNLRVFPLALENQALSSDDPMGLSNHHIYWEPSPWLDDWLPGNENNGWIPTRYWRGQWSKDLSFFTRDSEVKRLTALRGFSFKGDVSDNTNLGLTLAAPKSLWQDYDEITALPGALRMKSQLTDNFMLGTTDTFRVGYKNGKTDSINNVYSVDMSYDLTEGTNIVGEVGMSKSSDDRNSSYKIEKNGAIGHIGLKQETGVGEASIAVTHMDKGFDAGLTNYKETRQDQFWGRHIHFKKPLEYTSWGSDPMKYDDIDPFRIGNGVDTGRQAINFRLKTKEAMDGRTDNLIDYRWVRDSDGKYVEGVAREENTFKINQDWTSKLLFIYHDLPKTKGGIDPTQYDADTGEFLANSSIKDGEDPSLSTYSAGLEYAPEDWISVFGVYENTNDFTIATGNNPRGLLKETSFTGAPGEYIEGKYYTEKFYYLYNQGYFDLPPYERFNIYRTGISLRPMPRLGIELDYTKNDFKFSQSIDDNMNHFGAALKYEFNKKLTGFLKYTFSKAYNLYRLNTSGDLKYQDHHNVFMEFDYNVNEYGQLVIQFGEGSMTGSPLWYYVASPYGDFYPTLDTQHILRIYYNGRF
ncbi:MAG: hypothetical protein Q8O12_01135 [Candidatus Omnitrophota bacterium]|nr:hypothetical protein [Candidatus Omnitrophota bacterium]